MEHWQEIAYQQDMFLGQDKNSVCPSDNCEDENQEKARQEK